MNASNVLDELIQQAASQLEAEEINRQAAYDEKYQRVLEQLKREIGGEGMFELLDPYAKFEVSQHQRSVTIEMYVEANELRLAPFTIKTIGDGGGFAYCDVSGRTHSSFQNLLLRCRTMHPEWLAACRERQAKKLMGELNYWSKPDRTPDQANAICQELTQLWPERETEWRYWLAAFMKNKQEADLRAEIQQKQNEATERGKQEYEAAVRDYCNRWKAALEFNRQQLSELQRKLDISERFWKLSYGIIAVRDDEEELVDTYTAYVSSDVPGSDGTYWMVNRGKYELVKYYFPLSAQAIDVQPSTDGYGICRQISVPQAIGELVVLPGEEVYANAMAQLGQIVFMELPERPAVPSGLDDYDARRSQERIQDEMGLESLVW